VSGLIALAFGQRRKTLTNALSGKYPKEKTAEALAVCGLRADIRGERLSAEDFCRLALALA
jgi:16S rRNA A1518/A1519 N6-dimethyltransferase RsmA/KsgA/DIM1 with predicted DNA glycosylase/AP lyase activity